MCQALSGCCKWHEKKWDNIKMKGTWSLPLKSLLVEESIHIALWQQQGFAEAVGLHPSWHSRGDAICTIAGRFPCLQALGCSPMVVDAAIVGGLVERGFKLWWLILIGPWGAQTFGIYSGCLWVCFWIELTFELVDWVKQFNLPNVGGLPPISWRPESNKKTE